MVTATGFSGLFDTIQPTGLTLLDTQNIERRIARIFRNEGAREVSEIMQTLNGAAVGQTAAASYSRVDHTVDPGNSVVNGGARTIESVTVINRVTTAADQTRVNDILTENRAPDTYPVDLSGNGGGGKAV